MELGGACNREATVSMRPPAKAEEAIMQISEKMHGDVAVLALAGKFLGGKECTEVYAKTKQLIDQGVIKVVVDLGNVSLMNSSGLGALVGSLISLRKVDGALKLCCVKERMEGLLVASDVMQLFETHKSAIEAVEAFGGN
jgi:anti-sigma B factor antagonist